MSTTRNTRHAARCRKSFRSWPLDVPPKADYDGRVRDAVLDRILEDGLNVERTLAAMRRDFGLKLSKASSTTACAVASPGSTWSRTAA